MKRFSIFKPGNVAAPRYPILREIALGLLNFVLYAAGIVGVFQVFYSAELLGDKQMIRSFAVAGFFVGGFAGLWSRRWFGAVVPCVAAGVTLLMALNYDFQSLFGADRDPVLTRLWKAAGGLLSTSELTMVIVGTAVAAAGWWSVGTLFVRMQHAHGK
jgi:hypothetical protein